MNEEICGVASGHEGAEFAIREWIRALGCFPGTLARFLILGHAEPSGASETKSMHRKLQRWGCLGGDRNRSRIGSGTMPLYGFHRIFGVAQSLGTEVGEVPVHIRPASVVAVVLDPDGQPGRAAT